MTALEVTGRTTWRIHGGGIQHPQGGLEGNLVRCRWCGVTFYVREALRRDQFAAGGSGLGMALKRGERGGGLDVLELCAPADSWETLAGVVAQSDGMNRPVVRNRTFTARWAEEQLRTGERRL